MQKSGDRFLGPNPEIQIRPGTGLVLRDSEIAIESCIDSSRSWFRDKQGRYRGNIVTHTSFLKRYDGRLKIFENRIQEVSSCAAWR